MWGRGNLLGRIKQKLLKYNKTGPNSTITLPKENEKKSKRPDYLVQTRVVLNHKKYKSCNNPNTDVINTSFYLLQCIEQPGLTSPALLPQALKPSVCS